MSRTQRTPLSDADSEPQTALDPEAQLRATEAIELYEAAMRHYAAAAAAYTVPVRKTTSTSAARAARFACPEA